MEYQVREDERVTDAISRAVADVNDCSMVDLPPLYDAVDPDAIESLFDHGLSGSSSALHLSIRYGDATVTVRANGIISVTDDPLSADGPVASIES